MPLSLFPFASSKKAAFTLAEVLITLGIIGVVAAMTIPNLMSNFKWKRYKTQTLHTISAINQVSRLYIHEFGAPPSCGYWQTAPCVSVCAERNPDGSCKRNTCSDGSPLPSNYLGERSECPAFWDFLKSHLKVAQVCESNAYANGCIPKYRGIDTLRREVDPSKSDTDITKETDGCKYFRQKEMLETNPAIVLMDGTIIMPFYNYTWQLFLVDVNGKAGPNKWGYDMRAFAFQIADVSLFPQLVKGSCHPIEKGGKDTDELLKQ